MKILVIGNSHAAMIRQAAECDIGAGHDFTFFAQPKTGPTDVVFNRTHVQASSTPLKQTLKKLGMPLSVDFAEYDGIILVSMAASVFATTSLTQHHWVMDWHDTPPGDTRSPISVTLLETLVKDAIAQRTAAQFAQHIRHHVPHPIAVIGQPCPATAVLHDTAPRSRYVATAVQRQEGKYHLNVVETAHRSFFETFHRVKFINQPKHTIEQGCITKDIFTQGARRLDIRQAQKIDDVGHANVTYGRLVLQAALDYLQTS